MSADESLFQPIASGEVSKRAARGGVLLAVVQIGRGLIEAATMIVLARALLPSDFGLIDMVVSATGIIDMLKEFGLSSATIQREKIHHAQVSLLFWTNCAIGLGLTGIIAALAPVLVFVYEQPALLPITLALSFSTFLGAASVQHIAILRRNLRFQLLAAIDLTSAAVGNALAVWSAFRGDGVYALVVRQLAKLATQTVLAFLLCRWRPSAPRRAAIGDLLRFGGHVSGFQVINYIERNLDNVLVGRFAGAEQLGFYSRAYSLMRIPLDQINALSSVVVPTLSRLAPEPATYRTAYCKLSRCVLLLFVPLTPVLIYAADWLIPTVLGAQWRGSVPIFQCLAFGLLVKPLLNTTGWLWVTQGRTEELWRWGKLGGLIAVASFVVGLPWGALGVAAAYTVTDIVVRTPIVVWWIGRSGPVRSRDLLAAVAPGWTAGVVVAGCYPMLDRALLGLEPGVRVALCSIGSLGLGFGVAYVTPWGRRALRESADMVRTIARSR
jgi:O-antigen/teichoic acid export membrane protein